MSTFAKQILIASSEFPPGPGGIGNHAYCLANQLHTAGYMVSVITPASDRQKAVQQDTGLPYFIVRLPIGRPMSKLRLVTSTIRDLSLKGQLVVIASGLVMLVICGWYSFLFRRKNVRYILVAHGIDINPTSRLWRLLVRVGLKGFDVIVPVSSYTASRIVGVPNEKLRVINNGFDPARFQQLASLRPVAKKGSPNLITVGSVTYRKGQVNIVKALPTVAKAYPNVHYHMVGIAQEKDMVLRIAKDLGVDSHITFHGPLSDDALKEQLSACDIFVMLSKHDPSGDFEGFGIAVLEANFLGLPAIGSANSGLRDAISPGYSGFLIQPDDEGGLLHAIATILADYDKYSIQAKEHAIKFLWDKVARKYIDVIEGRN
jgi:phosphatidylinositol alpha-1,6-mannosyltransferase